MKCLAMFLPQFHNDHYNNAWWGDGFTEWQNVKAGTPLFAGHLQPRVPLDGYFDLSEPHELAKQAAMARAYGIDGFAIYDYWYENVQPLAKPLRVILDNHDIDISFSICWANHSWTRSWTNRTGEFDILIEQTYAGDPSGRQKHYEHLCEAFGDARYVRHNGLPFFQIYSPAAMGDCLEEYLAELRAFAVQRIGTDIHISAFINAWQSDWTYLKHFDSATLFQPSAALFSPVDVFSAPASSNVDFSVRLRALSPKLKRPLYLLRDLLPNRHKEFCYDSTWRNLIDQFAVAQRRSKLPINPMGFVNFDNTPRYKGRARLFHNYDVHKFRKYFSELTTIANSISPESIMFISAWNEWGEGAFLQPDIAEQHSRLEAVAHAVSRS